jgi:hypothetical protein
MPRPATQASSKWTGTASLPCGGLPALALGFGLLATGAAAPDLQARVLQVQVQQPGIAAPNAPGEVPAAPETGNGKPDEPLSDRLSRSQGVIKPPENVDSGIHAPAPEPNPGTTPVIPPPGTPGGDPNVQPK